MGFTVHHASPAKDTEFEVYARTLRHQGVDLGHVPRVLDPDTRRRWLYVWDTQDQAEAFAKELTKRTRDQVWEVVPVNGTTSVGPWGPLVIQLARRSDKLILSLPPLSKGTLQSAYPKAFGFHRFFIDTDRWYEYQKTQGNLADLVRQVGPSLTGLSLEQLDALGYVVIDDQTEDTVVFVPPAEPAQI